VVPLIHNAHLFGVLDLDSPRPARFDAEDAQGLNQAAELLLQSSDLVHYADPVV
jgi:GAF domain-containing protein